MVDRALYKSSFSLVIYDFYNQTLQQTVVTPNHCHYFIRHYYHIYSTLLYLFDTIIIIIYLTLLSYLFDTISYRNLFILLKTFEIRPPFYKGQNFIPDVGHYREVLLYETKLKLPFAYNYYSVNNPPVLICRTELCPQ